LAEHTVLVGGVCWQTVEFQMQLNAAFAARGLISLNPDGSFADYKAWSQSNGLSSLVYLKNPSNMGVHEETEALLNKLKECGDSGIDRIITREDAATRYRLYGSFSFVVCSDGKTVFDNGWQSENLEATAQTACGQIGDDENGWMLAIGPRFTDARIETVYAIPDVAATCAKLLDLRLPMSKGKPIAEILAE
ncbi:MAG: hypothetical protein IKU55_00520, partial [Clostridia bacterium]|nr:hypothetical protein [Clostridia bacterium]